MKKIIIGVSVFIILGTMYFYLFNPDELKKIGYSKDEVKIIKEKLTEEEINKIKQYDYLSNLINFITNNNFEKEKLDNYLNYYQKNKNVSVDNIITLVNAEIDTLNIDYDDIIIDLLNEQYFIIDNLERYIDYNKNNNYTTKEIITNVNSNIDYEFYTNTKSTDIKKDILMLVNKYYKLDSNYIPNDLEKIDSKYSVWGSLRSVALKPFYEMCNDALKENLVLLNTSPYRSYDVQLGLYNDYVLSDGKVNADTYSARPGHSEHQTGLAIDFITPTSNLDTFVYTKESDWLKKNAYKYGFILRYPKGKEYITGYKYEPWHYRYVGIEVATYIYEHDITFEEYYAYFLENK